MVQKYGDYHLACLLVTCKFDFFLQLLLQVSLQVVQSVFVGYIAEYFSYVEPTDDQFRDVCLFSLGLVLTGLLASFVHAYGFFIGYRAGMDARIITTSAIYEKVHVLCNLYHMYILMRCIVIEF